MDGYYFRIQLSNMCYEVMKLCPLVKSLHLFDMVGGEGKYPIFERNRYDVTVHIYNEYYCRITGKEEY